MSVNLGFNMIVDFETEREARVLIRFETRQEIQEHLEKVKRQLDTKPPLWIKDLYERDLAVLEKAIQLLDK